MNRDLKALFMIALRMMLYGVVLGAIAGFLVVITFALIAGDSDVLEAFFTVVMLSVGIGGGFGILFGGFGGLFSGIAMMLATAVFYREIPNPRNYKYAMAFITFIITGGVFVLSELFIGEITMFFVALLSTFIAVQASQRVSKKYLSEIDVRKVKEKMA